MKKRKARVVFVVFCGDEAEYVLTTEPTDAFYERMRREEMEIVKFIEADRKDKK